MVAENKVRKFLASRDWRIWLGLIITVIWMASGIWYVAYVSETQPTKNFSLDAVGSFLEGVFAPLAFLWLVIGLFIQQRELQRIPRHCEKRPNNRRNRPRRSLRRK